MGLMETLGARAAFQGRSAPVDCGELGTVTVETLPLRDLELLYRGPDGARAVFYAACRDLQQAGEAMRRAGQLYTPDGVMQFVSDQEAAAAARTVLELSGWNGGSGAKETAEPVGAVPEFQEIRYESVQNSGDFWESGQVSREKKRFSDDFGLDLDSGKKAQVFGSFPAVRAQNVVSELSEEGEVHETKSEILEGVREIESEFGRAQARALLETELEFPAPAPIETHEIESEVPETVYKIKMEATEPVHEIKSESRKLALHSKEQDKTGLRKGENDIRPKALNETESEFEETPHETKSEKTPEVLANEEEQAERMARLLLEGLRRAKWVRGG